MLKKKAQVKFGESIGIIIIVFFILMSGLIWYDKINKSSLEDISKEDQQFRAFEKYHFLRQLDLIHVSQRGIVDKKFDLNSLILFSEFVKTSTGKEYAFSKFKKSTIQIGIYNNFDELNDNNPSTKILLYNNTPNENDKILENTIFRTYFPILNSSSKKVLIGLVEIESFILK